MQKDGVEKEKITYTYDDNHNLLTATAQSGVKTVYTYPAGTANKGMPLNVRVQDSTGNTSSSVSYEYTGNYNYITKQTDARGMQTCYVTQPLQEPAFTW